MAHAIIIEDSQGELVDVVAYCSDSCAKTSEHYAGWYGCYEPSFSTECPNCNQFIRGSN